MNSNSTSIAIAAFLLVAGGAAWWALSSGDPAPPEAPTVASTPNAARTPASGAASPTSPEFQSDVEALRRDIAAQIAAGASAAPTETVGITDYELPPVFHVARGLDREGVVPGEPVTAAAMKQPKMSALDVEDEDYDEVVETHQLFNAFEMDILARGEMTQADWDELEAKYAPAKEAMLNRSVELAHAGLADQNESMLLEWNALESGYREQVE